MSLSSRREHVRSTTALSHGANGGRQADPTVNCEINQFVTFCGACRPRSSKEATANHSVWMAARNASNSKR